MAKKIIEARVIQKVGTAQEWADDDFVLMDGEMGFERTSSGLPVNFKVGDNDKRYSELPYFHPYIINGSISTTQTTAELNALENGVYSAKGAGTYANGLVANEGQYTTFRKTDDGWSLDARVDVTWESPDLTPIEAELADHEQRITSNENRLDEYFEYIGGNTVNIARANERINNLNETHIKMIGEYPDLDNPTYQSSFNRRLFNYVKNGLSANSNFKTNTSNNVTNSFNFGTLEWRFNQTAGVPYITASGYTTRFGSKLTHEQNEDNRGELDKSGVGGKLEGVNWKVQKLSGQTQASNINLPITGATFRTAIVSVNGEYADENGNIVVSGGGGGYILPPASAGTLGGIKVGSGLSITPDGVLSATGGGGYVLPSATTTTLGGVKVDGSTIVINGSGVISATGGGGGGGYVLPEATTTILGGVKIDGVTITKNSNGQLISNNIETIRVALSALDTNLVAGVDLNGFIALESFKVKDFKITAFPVPTGSSLITGIKKNGTIITTTNASIAPNQNNSTTTTQPVFSSDTFALGDRLNFFIPSGGVGSVNTGQNLIATLKIEKL